MQVKKTWKQVDGVLLLDKPYGLSSNSALQQARRLFSAAKGGHTGTLDPLATGLLPLCFGEATKFSADLLDADKTYIATLKLGVKTDSGDAEGNVIETRPVVVGLTDIEGVLPRFLGEIDQIPPMHSALKRDGKPLYELARQGVVVERAPRRIRIFSIVLVSFAGDELVLEVHCSKGTYIRVLGEDIGAMLGCGAHLSALRRTRVGNLDLHGASSLEQIEQAAESERLGLLAPVDRLLQELPALILEGEGAERFRHGNRTAVGSQTQGKVRVYAQGQLIGLGEIDDEGVVHPKRLVHLSLPKSDA